MVNEIREISSKLGPMSEEEWGNIQRLFNIVVTKLGVRIPDDAEFAELRRLIEEERASDTARKNLDQLPASRTASVNPNNWVPALYQPQKDVNNGNGLIQAFSNLFDEEIYDYPLPGCYIIELTYVFADEDHPSLDWYYDVIRLTLFGRIEDIETFFIVVNRATGKIVRLSFIEVWLWWGGIPPETRVFDPIYSSSATWDQTAHYWAHVLSMTYYSGNHPKIYVNTWNHAMAELDNNPSLTKKVFATFTSTDGNRLVAENTYTTLGYWAEWLEESP